MKNWYRPSFDLLTCPLRPSLVLRVLDRREGEALLRPGNLSLVPQQLADNLHQLKVWAGRDQQQPVDEVNRQRKASREMTHDCMTDLRLLRYKNSTLLAYFCVYRQDSSCW